VTKYLNSVATSLNRCRSEQSGNSKYSLVLKHETNLRAVLELYPEAVKLFEQAYEVNPNNSPDQIKSIFCQKEAVSVYGYKQLEILLEKIDGFAGALSNYMGVKQKVLKEQDLLISKVLNRCREYYFSADKYLLVLMHEVDLRTVFRDYPDAVELFERQMNLILADEKIESPYGHDMLERQLEETDGLADALSAYIKMKQKMLEEPDLLISEILKRCNSKHQSDTNGYQLVSKYEANIRTLVRLYSDAVELFKRAYQANPGDPRGQMNLILEQEEIESPDGYDDLEELLKSSKGFTDALICYVKVEQEVRQEMVKKKLQQKKSSGVDIGLAKKKIPNEDSVNALISLSSFLITGDKKKKRACARQLAARKMKLKLNEENVRGVIGKTGNEKQCNGERCDAARLESALTHYSIIGGGNETSAREVASSAPMLDEKPPEVESSVRSPKP
jgi:tetratricopeptide (TPR) repeat protein